MTTKGESSGRECRRTKEGERKREKKEGGRGLSIWRTDPGNHI